MLSIAWTKKFSLRYVDAAMPSQLPSFSIYPISQATTATFAKLYFRLTFLFFVERGSKRVLTHDGKELIGEEGDVFVFPPGSMVTMENRPRLTKSYRATGISYSQELIDLATSTAETSVPDQGPELLKPNPSESKRILAAIKAAVNEKNLPQAVLTHRQLEPIIWLRSHGIHLQKLATQNPIGLVRQLIETDLAYSWQAKEIAHALGMSQPTMRRRLSDAGQGFAKILLFTRLERGLTLLQTSHEPITQIAYECGFKTPAHFSDAFRKRFGIRPKDIRTPAI